MIASFVKCRNWTRVVPGFSKLSFSSLVLPGFVTKDIAFPHVGNHMCITYVFWGWCVLGPHCTAAFTGPFCCSPAVAPEAPPPRPACGQRGLLCYGFQFFFPPKCSSLPLSLFSGVFLMAGITFSHPIPWKGRPQGQNLFPFSPVSLQIWAWHSVNRCSIHVEEWIEFSLLEHLCLSLKAPVFVCLNCRNSS